MTARPQLLLVTMLEGLFLLLLLLLLLWVRLLLLLAAAAMRLSLMHPPPQQLFAASFRVFFAYPRSNSWSCWKGMCAACALYSHAWGSSLVAPWACQRQRRWR